MSVEAEGGYGHPYSPFSWPPRGRAFPIPASGFNVHPLCGSLVRALLLLLYLVPNPDGPLGDSSARAICY